MTNSSLLRRLLTLRHNYVNPVDRRRAQILLTILMAGIPLAGVYLLQAFVAQAVVGYEIEFIDLTPIFPLVLAMVALILLQSGRLSEASLFFVSMLYFNNVLIFANSNLIITPAFILVAIPLSLATFLFDQRGFTIMLIASLLQALTAGTITVGSLGDYLSDPTSVGAIVVLLTLGGIFYTSSGSLSAISQAGVREAELYRKVGAFAEKIGEIDDQSRLFTVTLNTIRNELGYSFAQLFLADERGLITRRFRTGLNIPEGGIFTDVSVADVSALTESLRAERVLRLSLQDSQVRRAHFLPATYYGIVLPVRIGDRVIGVLDVQKTQTSFSNAEIRAIEALITQVGLLLMYIITVNDLRASVDNLTTTTSSLRSQLRIYKESEREIVSATWDNYMQMRNQSTFGYDLSLTGITPAHDLPDDLAETMREGEVDVRLEDGLRVVRVPIMIRGEILGAMAFHLPPESPFGERQMDFARSLTTRLALALENKRLFESSQAQALRERKANEITSLLIGATDVDSVLDVAAQSFNDALGAISTRIRIDAELLSDSFEASSPYSPISEGDTAE